MSVRAPGILADHQIHALVEGGGVIGTPALLPAQIQPSSLDLRLGPVAYRIRASFLTGPSHTVKDKLGDVVMHEMDLTRGAVMETGCVYLVPLAEALALPGDIAAIANPKSSTGRLDVFTRLIVDGGAAFDRADAGYRGPLYAEISPRSFSILVRAGVRLNQMRFRQGHALLDDAALADLNAREQLVAGKADIDAGIALSADLAGAGAEGLIGYRAKRHTGVIDVERIGAYDPAKFWEPLHAGESGTLILDPNEFYILASKEAVHVPPDYAAEMVPFNPLVGEFRVHYAGFFDPGFGHAAAGGHGARAVLEVRSHEVPFILEDGQVIGRLVYERLAARPTTLYGQGIGSSYQRQGLALSKHFTRA